MTITPLFRAANLAEAILWFTIAAICAIATIWNKGIRVDLIFAVLYFTAFGISDLVERNTGTWYSPWWLLAWKITCVAGFLTLLLRYIQRRKTARKFTPKLKPPEKIP